jgi:microcystin-dependent protein
MSSTYSTNLAIELIGTGDQAGNWGSTTNTNLGTLLEQAISGYVTQAVSTGTDTTLAMTNGASATARTIFIELTGTGGTATNLVVPSNKKLYFIYNNTTGAVTVKVSGQTGVSVPAAAKMVLVSNGTDIVVATNYMASLTLGAALPVLSGGTGVTTSTGSGANVLSTSPTLVTPVLGTPTSGNFSTGTFTWPTFNQNTTGTAAGLSATLAVASGGTGVTTSTGTGSTVLSASPTFTGTPLAPTASVGTNTTQIATTAFVTAGIQTAYPVGSIYMSTVSTDPATLFGFGTWVAFGAGRVLISQNGTYTAGSTGGSATTTLIEANLPSHSHSASSSSSVSDPGHRHQIGGRDSTANEGSDPNSEFVRDYPSVQNPYSSTVTTGISVSTSTSIGNTGSGTAFSNLPPYIAVYMWNRTV